MMKTDEITTAHPKKIPSKPTRKILMEKQILRSPCRSPHGFPSSATKAPSSHGAFVETETWENARYIAPINSVNLSSR